MVRVLKEPEERKQEILDTAMRLFREKGYDATSIVDIAKAMNVASGLCYRYFESKKDIFDAAVNQYAVESSKEFLEVILDREKSFKERLELFGKVMLTKEDHSKHHNFFHTPGNETFHLQLGIEMFHYLAPYISEELRILSEKGEISADDPKLMTEFLLYGQMTLWLSPETDDPHGRPFKERLKQIKRYIYKLLEVN